MKAVEREFLDRKCQGMFEVQRYEILELCKSMEIDQPISWLRGQAHGKNIVMEKVRQLKFWKAINGIIENFKSEHPYDKDIVNQLLAGGMTKEEIRLYRELTVKVAKAFYGKEKS